MILIATSFHGNKTIASCAVEKDGEACHLNVERPTGAKAINVLVGRLARMRLGGEEYRVIGEPEIAGVVPTWPYRRRGGASRRAAEPLRGVA